MDPRSFGAGRNLIPVGNRIFFAIRLIMSFETEQVKPFENRSNALRQVSERYCSYSGCKAKARLSLRISCSRMCEQSYSSTGKWRYISTFS